MISTLRRGANAILFVIACLLGADTADAIIAAVVLPPPVHKPESPGVEPVVAAAAWKDRQVILDRNVFGSSALAPAASAATVEDNLEATKLPLTLLGTAASEDPRFAWAAIQDRDSRSTLIVGIGGSIQDKATVVRIERRRVVLLEGGAHRELVFDENDLTPRLASTGAPAPAPAGGRVAARAAARAAALRDQAEALSVPREEVQASLRNPAEIFSQARILPKYEDGQMRGVQVSQIKPGSLFEQVGIREGDVITELNGIPINGPEQSPKILQEFTTADSITASVVGPDGQSRQVSGKISGSGQ